MFFSFAPDQLRQWQVDQAQLAARSDDVAITAMHVELMAFYDEQARAIEVADPATIMRWDTALAASHATATLLMRHRVGSQVED